MQIHYKYEYEATPLFKIKLLDTVTLCFRAFGERLKITKPYIHRCLFVGYRTAFYSLFLSQIISQRRLSIYKELQCRVTPGLHFSPA